jgi:hypothetical protein
LEDLNWFHFVILGSGNASSHDGPKIAGKKKKPTKRGLVVSKSQSNIKNGLVTTSGYFFVRD